MDDEHDDIAARLSVLQRRLDLLEALLRAARHDLDGETHRASTPSRVDHDVPVSTAAR